MLYGLKNNRARDSNPQPVDAKTSVRSTTLWQIESLFYSSCIVMHMFVCMYFLEMFYAR